MQVSSSALLDRFDRWRRNQTLAHPQQWLAYDVAHLFSGYHFDSTVYGLAAVSGACASFTDPPRNSGITSATLSAEFTAAIFAHELGHNLGMTHVGTGAAGSCAADSRDVMSASTCLNCGQTQRRWSACSQTSLTAFLTANSGVTAACLSTQSANTTWAQRPPVCANGLIEPGETCDCGQADCSAIDPCCDGTRCLLYAGAVVASVVCHID